MKQISQIHYKTTMYRGRVRNFAGETRKRNISLPLLLGHSPTQSLFNWPSVTATAEITAGTGFLESNAGRSVIVPEFQRHPP